MRKINPKQFFLAQRRTSRLINRQIVLTLIRTHQPVSRADLARLMKTNRANVTLLVNEMLSEGLIFEGATGEATRGRKPIFLHINASNRCVVAVDIRATRTYIMLTDLIGKQLDNIISFPTLFNLKKLVPELSKNIKQLLAKGGGATACEGVGVVVPGIVNPKTGMVLSAPMLGWRNQPLRNLLAASLRLPVHVETSGKACALAQVWSAQGNTTLNNDLVFVSVSDGVSVGVVFNGEVVRGQHNIAGELGHVPLSMDGPRCSCGAQGCWEAYVSNLATLSRYFGRELAFPQEGASAIPNFSIDDLIARAQGEDERAVSALRATGRYLGLGLASIINAINPSCIHIGGEITAVWDLIEPMVKAALKERVLTDAAAGTVIRIVPTMEYPRLRGAVALVTAPAFAAPRVA